MFSKTLTKLIDEAILPAVILIVAKIASLLVVNRALNLSWQFKGFGISYSSFADFVLANSYSSLFMFGAIFAFTLWVLFKSHFLHDSHISPASSARLVSGGLTFLIQNSFKLYSQAFIWLSYSWLCATILGLMAMSGLVLGFIFYTAAAFSLLATVLFILDIEKEFSIREDSDFVLSE